MADDVTDLTDLLKIADTLLDRDKATAARISQELDAQRAQIEQINGLFDNLFETGVAAFPRQRMGTDQLWHNRLVQMRETANYAMAGLRAQQEAHRDQLNESFARVEALKQLQYHQEQQARLDASRKEEDDMTEWAVFRSRRKAG